MDNKTSFRQLHSEMDKHISNEKFRKYIEDFTYFHNNDVPDPSDDDIHMEEFQGLPDIPYIDYIIDFTSSETAADTYYKYIDV